MSDLFADLLGQERAVTLLDAALERRRLAPAYLFAGADGVGRRLAALRLANLCVPDRFKSVTARQVKAAGPGSLQWR